MPKRSIMLFILIFSTSLFIMNTSNSLLATEKGEKGCKFKVKRCPVSGKIISKDAKNIKTDYQGKTYHFCCQGCKAKFEKDPEKYLKKCQAKDFYYCPKEECQYKSDKPGKCPHCGVELKKHEHKTFYVCPTEGCHYKSDKSGKCPHCKAELKKYEHKTSYACPMEGCHYKSDKPGKCPKCGMELKKQECTCHKHKHKCTHKKTEKKEGQ